MLVGPLTRYYHGVSLPIQVVLGDDNSWYLGTINPLTGVKTRESKDTYPTKEGAQMSLDLRTFEYASGFGKPESLVKEESNKGWVNEYPDNLAPTLTTVDEVTVQHYEPYNEMSDFLKSLDDFLEDDITWPGYEYD